MNDEKKKLRKNNSKGKNRDLFKKIRDIKVIFHPRMGTMGRNSKDLVEAEEIKRRWYKYTELYKKGLTDPDNHDGVVTHLKSDILKCEVKWVLERITMNKDIGGNGIPAELFKFLKLEAVKVLHQYVNKFKKLSSGHRTRKGQFLVQSQRRVI